MAHKSCRVVQNIKFPKQWDRKDIDAFLKRFSHSGLYSIDAFLETNRENA